jgi:hypothetical protein
MDKEKFLEQLREETAKKIKEKSEKYINPFIGRVLSNMNNYIIIDYFEVNIDDRFEGLDISDLINNLEFTFYVYGFYFGDILYAKNKDFGKYGLISAERTSLDYKAKDIDLENLLNSMQYNLTSQDDINLETIKKAYDLLKGCKYENNK